MPLNGVDVSVDALASTAEIALRNLKGGILAVVLRNADGAFGRHLLASVDIDPSKSNVRSDMAMAGPGRSSSLTSGAGTLGDNFRTPFNADDVPASSQEVLRLARAVVGEVERREGQARSLIFEQPQAELECSLRAHAFPPQDPDGAPPPVIGRMQHDWNPNNFHEIRQVDEREGGRMHGHVDQSGTDGVVLLNLGGCDFFFDIGKGRGKGHCTAQKTKEQWCVGNGHGGHWVTAADAPPERYHSIDSRAPKWLLRDRLCATCAAGGQGQQCASCAQGTVQLHSGDLVIFTGCGAFHGVSKVTTNQEGSLALRQPAGTPPLPPWAESRLDAGWRVSLQWRLTSRKVVHDKSLKEMEAQLKSAVQHGIVGAPPVPVSGFDMGFGVAGSEPDPELAAAIAASLADHLQQPQPAPQPVVTAAHDEERDPELAAAIALSLQEKQQSHVGMRSAQNEKMSGVIELLSDSEDEAPVVVPSTGGGEKRAAADLLDVDGMRQARLARFER